ncbi:hypothetical protein TSUD_46670 [Trifolium subterraneum]|nr:hypothetical protein TSUD_46670 [Trifolium subterraneum]
MASTTLPLVKTTLETPYTVPFSAVEISHKAHAKTVFPQHPSKSFKTVLNQKNQLFG